MIDKTINEGTWMQRRFIALEKEPGGQFLALHWPEHDQSELAGLVGSRVEVEGTLWFESITARMIRPV